jgi:hypothetical protein
MLNLLDSSFIFIPGIEMSVNNSQGDIVHALTYPDPYNTTSLPYLGDGGGDESGTDISVEMLCDSLEKYNGFLLHGSSICRR